jgi:protein O-GlcNAc transferase
MRRWFTRKSSPPPVPPNASDADDVATLLQEADAARARADRRGAGALYARAHALAPDRVYPLFWLADGAFAAGDLAVARQWCERGLAIAPDEVGLLLQMGRIAHAADDPFLALQCYERVAAINPDLPEIDGLLADEYCLLGRVADGVAAFERALARHPESTGTQSNRLFVLNYAPILDPEQLFAEHRRWGAVHEARVAAPRPPHAGSREPERRLRIGYVSPDLRTHAVTQFVEPLLRAHDKSAYEIHCFDTSPYPPDAVTARLKAHAHVWHRVADLDDDALDATIRAIRIDVLVDLSGHTMFNRLPVFARKPAPVQATWLGYLNTTGLTAMDYRITDGYLDPEGTTEHLHTETLLRLPHHACLALPSPQGPPVNALPTDETGIVTFAAVNQWSKSSPEARDMWARILGACDHARLLIVARGARSEDFRRSVTADLVRRGARAHQISLLPPMPLPDFLALFHRIDVALDAWPYGGGTTTLHSLWMGVPVVTLAGATAMSRNSIGPLAAVGLQHLVATTPAGYVQAALDLARDPAWLRGTRATLRERMLASPLVDERGFARNMEGAYRTMWRNFCAGRRADHLQRAIRSS